MAKNWEQELIAKAESRKALIGVVGLGYVGLPLVAEMAEAGYQVLGFDVTQRIVDTVNRGVSHVQDVPSERLARYVKAGKVSATTDLSRMGEFETCKALERLIDAGFVRALPQESPRKPSAEATVGGISARARARAVSITGTPPV